MKKYDSIIYLLKIDTPDKNLYKIGSTQGLIEDRIKALQTGCPYKIKLADKYDSQFGQIVERTLHNLFKHKHTHGEWFDLDLTEEFKFIETCKMIEENHIFLEKNKIE